jgi:hypothetical protein
VPANLAPALSVALVLGTMPGALDFACSPSLELLAHTVGKSRLVLRGVSHLKPLRSLSSTVRRTRTSRNEARTAGAQRGLQTSPKQAM